MTEPRRLGLLTAVSAAGAFFQIAVSFELALVFSEAWLGLATVFMLGHVGFGIGAWLASRRRISNEAAAPARPIAAAGRVLTARGGGTSAPYGAVAGLILVSLACLLRLSPAHLPETTLLAAAAATTGALAAFGWRFSELLRGAPRLGAASAAAALGYGAGLAAATAAVPALGANAALLSLAGVLAASRFGSTGVALALLVAGLAGRFDLDSRLEKARPLKLVFNVSHSGVDKLFADIASCRHWSLWSPYAKIDIFKHPVQQFIIGAYNHRVLWNWSLAQIPGEYPGFAFLRPTDRTALIGASAGFESRFMPTDMPPKHLTLVEIDPAVVGFFRVRPEENNGVFLRYPTVVADGRSFLDRRLGSLDALIVGSLDSTARSPWRSSPLNSSLYTREAVLRAASVVGPEGLLLYIPRDERLARSALRVGDEAGLLSWAFYRHIPPTASALGELISNGEYNLLMSRSRRRLEEAVASIERVLRIAPKRSILGPFSLDLSSSERLLRSWRTLPGEPLSDDLPFVAGHDPELRPYLKFAAGIVLALLAAVAAATRLQRTGGTWPLYCLLIGCGSLALQLSLIGRWRSCFGDPVRTAVVVSSLLFVGQAVGAGLSDRGRLPSPAIRLAVLAFAAAWTAAGLRLVPYGEPSAAWAAAASALILAPAAVISGLFFPIGLRGAGPQGLGAALFCDGLGAAFGYALSLILSQLWGFSSVLAVVGLCYGGAASLARDP